MAMFESKSTKFLIRTVLVIIGVCLLAIGFICNPPFKTKPTADPPAQDSTVQEYAAEEIPIVKTPFKSTVEPILFEAAFVRGTTVEEGGDTLEFTLRDVGKLKVTSGKIIACDPIQISNAPPLIYDFPKGEFPVQVAMLGKDLAMSRILFSDKPVAKWQVALEPGEVPVPLDSAYCYGVDAGLGLFVDKEASVAFNALGEPGAEALYDSLENRPYPTAEIYPFGDHHLAVFTTGYGDGCYPTYIGRDSSGQICRLLTDFKIVPWELPK